jgi:uncharacterized protein (DUF58 family)
MQTLTLRQRFSLARFLRGLGPEAGPVQLDRSRIFILPTATGLLFAVVLLVMLLGAINYANNMGYMFTFLLGSMALVSILHSYRNLAQLQFAAGRAEPVFAGERAAFDILIGNPGERPRYAIELELPGGTPVSVDVAGGQTAGATLHRPAQRRGRLAPGRIRISTLYPLGLFRAWAYVELDMSCVVYPRPGPARGVPPHAVYRPNRAGDKGRGVDDFAGFRPYRPGDSPRHLFWKAAARDQALLVKQFGGDRADELWLDWNDLPDLPTEGRLEQLCRWVIDADRQQLRYGLRLPGSEQPIDSGPGQRARCLEMLALHPG